MNCKVLGNAQIAYSTNPNSTGYNGFESKSSNATGFDNYQQYHTLPLPSNKIVSNEVVPSGQTKNMTGYTKGKVGTFTLS